MNLVEIFERGNKLNELDLSQSPEFILLQIVDDQELLQGHVVRVDVAIDLTLHLDPLIQDGP